jgi:hypothetical protein
MTPAGRMPRAAFGLAVAPLVAIGLARFAYALLLPAMRAGSAYSPDALSGAGAN